MMFRTHILFALFFYLLFIKIFSIQVSLIFIGILAFGAILPDVDSPSSFVNRKYLFGIGKGISLFSEHRGFFHSIYGILITAVVSIIFVYFVKASFIYTLALPLGYFMHLAADSLNVSGIKWFWKTEKLHLKGPIKTGSIFEQLFFFVFLIATVYILIGNSGIQGIVGFVSKALG